MYDCIQHELADWLNEWNGSESKSKSRRRMKMKEEHKNKHFYILVLFVFVLKNIHLFSLKFINFTRFCWHVAKKEERNSKKQKKKTRMHICDSFVCLFSVCLFVRLFKCLLFILDFKLKFNFQCSLQHDSCWFVGCFGYLLVMVC